MVRAHDPLSPGEIFDGVPYVRKLPVDDGRHLITGVEQHVLRGRSRRARAPSPPSLGPKTHRGPAPAAFAPPVQPPGGPAPASARAVPDPVRPPDNRPRSGCGRAQGGVARRTGPPTPGAPEPPC